MVHAAGEGPTRVCGERNPSLRELRMNRSGESIAMLTLASLTVGNRLTYAVVDLIAGSFQALLSVEFQSRQPNLIW